MKLDDLIERETDRLVELNQYEKNLVKLSLRTIAKETIEEIMPEKRSNLKFENEFMFKSPYIQGFNNCRDQITQKAKE